MIIIVSVCSCIFFRRIYIVACIESVSIYSNVPLFVVSITFLFAFACVLPPSFSCTHSHTIDYAMDECFCRFFNLFSVRFSAGTFWLYFFFILSCISIVEFRKVFSLQPFWSVFPAKVRCCPSVIRFPLPSTTPHVNGNISFSFCFVHKSNRMDAACLWMHIYVHVFSKRDMNRKWRKK